MIRALDLLTPFISEVFRSSNSNRSRSKWDVFKRTFGVSIFLISIMLNWWLGKRMVNLSYQVFKQRETVAELQMCKVDLEKAEKINDFFKSAITQPEVTADTGRKYNQYLASLASTEEGVSQSPKETKPEPAKPPKAQAKAPASAAKKPKHGNAKNTDRPDKVSPSRYSRD